MTLISEFFLASDHLSKMHTKLCTRKEFAHVRLRTKGILLGRGGTLEYKILWGLLQRPLSNNKLFLTRNSHGIKETED